MVKNTFKKNYPKIKLFCRPAPSDFVFKHYLSVKFVIMCPYIFLLEMNKVIKVYQFLCYLFLFV